MAKSSKISRIMEFFRSGDKDEVRAVALMAAKVLTARGILIPMPGPVVEPVPGTGPKKRKRRGNKGDAASGTDGAASTDAGKEK